MEALAADLAGGPVPPETLVELVLETNDIVVRDGFISLLRFEELIEMSKRRVSDHQTHNGWARAIAERFAHELVRTCPLVDCVALSGSAASGGYSPSDDIDFDLFVVDDAKYLAYAIALMLGARVSIRHRRTHGLRKLICINVLWTRSESLPFQRQDEHLAFELLRCRPLIGSMQFARVLDVNGWTRQYFPQLSVQPISERSSTANLVGLLLGWIARRPGLLRAVNEISRVVTHAVYRGAHWLNRGDTQARARLAFIQLVKYPYEVFQD